MLTIGVETEYRSVSRSLSRWGLKGEPNAPNHHWEQGHGFLEAVEVDLMIGLIHDSYRRWERGHRFLEAVEVDLTTRLIHDSYRRWERDHRFLEAVEVDLTIGLIYDSYRH
jgi:hypothetical protein